MHLDVYKRQELYIGMDNAVGLGHTTVMLISVIAIPVCVALCAIVPGNRIIPIASLAACGYNCSMLNVVHRGKVGRTLLSCTIFLALTLVIASIMAPKITAVSYTHLDVYKRQVLLLTGWLIRKALMLNIVILNRDVLTQVLDAVLVLLRHCFSV